MNNGKIEKPVRPKVSLGCERFEDRINPTGWLDDYAAWWDRNLGGNWYDSTVGAADGTCCRVYRRNADYRDRRSTLGWHDACRYPRRNCTFRGLSNNSQIFPDQK